MATLEKRGRGWRAKIRRQGLGSISRQFRTKAEAIAWATEIEHRHLSRAIPANHFRGINLTLYAALDRYCREVTPLKRGARQEKLRVAKWMREPISRERLIDISTRDLSSFRDRRLSEGASPNTVRLELALISHVFTVAKREWGFEQMANPAQLIRKPPLPQGRQRRLNGDEEHRLVENAQRCPNPWIAPIIIFALETAMRQGEILSLRWEDINFELRTALLRMTKNGSRRTVPLSKRALNVLFEVGPKPSGRVFPFTGNAVRLAFSRLRSSLSIEDLRFHDLRHEATSRFFERGLNQLEVAAITGHKTLQMLQRYTHLRAEDLAQRLD